MPKMVTRQIVELWRLKSAEGKQYRQIADETGWDVRTVTKHLEPDLQTTEARTIRLQLFKERLGDHWDLLIRKVCESLLTIRAPDPADNMEQVGSSGALTFDMPGAIADRDESWHVAVSVKARGFREGTLLLEHLPRDPLWISVKNWEDAVAAELLAKRGLFFYSGEYLRNEVGWPIEDDSSDQHDVFFQGMQALLYHHSLFMACGIEVTPLTPELFTVDAEDVTTAHGRRLAKSPGGTDVVYKAYVEGVDHLASSPDAKAVAQGHARVQVATHDLRQMADDIRLLPYLPGVCSLCGRIEI